MSYQADVAPLPELAVPAKAWRAPEGSLGKSRERPAWLLVLPSLLVVAIVAVYPLYETFRLSFTNTRLASARVPRNVGLDNYQTLLQEDAFRSALGHTVVFTVSSVVLETLLGLAIALVIHSNFRGRGGVRTSMLVPWAIPTVVSAAMWQWMYNDVYGVVNDILVYRLHVLDKKVAWLADPNLALPAIIAVDVWKTTPFMALLLLAGLQLIPGDVYEASYVDGASKVQQFFQMTLPLIRPALLVALIFRTLDAFRVFDVIYVMKQFAPETMTVAVYARQQLIDLAKLGRGSAAGGRLFFCFFFFFVIFPRLIRVEEM